MSYSLVRRRVPRIAHPPQAPAKLPAVEVRIDAELPRRHQSGEKTEPIRIAIACMTKRPNDLSTWLTHHTENIGVTRFYLRVEETPELAEMLLQLPWSECVQATFAEGAECVRDNGSDQTARQMAHVNSAIKDAHAAGFTYMLHLDDDELLYAPCGRAALHDELYACSKSDAPWLHNVHALTIEALVPSRTCRAPFHEARAFRHCPGDFGSYGGQSAASTGKSFGVLTASGLEAEGPHHFRRWLRTTFALPHVR